MAQSGAGEPIFILGVPRSGTTLLRTILDSHSGIACGPETPWLGGHQPHSVMELCRFMTEDRRGYAASYGMPRSAVMGAAREMVSRLMGEYARAKGKRRWAEKTPDNVLYVDFLLELFPEARIIHLVRDGLDVAVSTSTVAEHRRGISEWHERHLSLDAALPAVENNEFNALLRWRHWNGLVERSLKGREHLRVGFERLVTEPRETVREITEFVGEPFEPGMLEYGRVEHDFPDWEWGSADVKAAGAIRPDRAGRARRELSAAKYSVLEGLARPDGERPRPCAALASVREVEDERFGMLMGWVNSFAGPLGLMTFKDWSKVWEYPWLWFNALSHVDWRGKHLVDLGSERSAMPWVCALLGAKVTMIETNGQFAPLWGRLRDRLRVDVDWKIVDSERIPLDDGSADVLTSFSVIEHQPDKRAAVTEAARVLKPRGVFGLSFDVCEPAMGMKFPEWNGRALTLGEFEREVWGHPAFGGPERPAWNLGDIPGFLEWHRRSAPHHTYVVGAAVLTKAGAEGPR